MRPQRASPFGAEIAATLTLALPLCLNQVGWHMLGVVDTAVLGHYSDAAQAGAGIANGVFFAVSVIGMGSILGLDPLMSQALGAGERRYARWLVGRGLRLAVVLGIPLSVLALIATLMLPLLGVEAETARQARIFVIGRLPGLVPMLMFTSCRVYLQATGRTRPLVLAILAGNLLNLVGDMLLIFGDRSLVRVGLPAIGLPALGVLGSALASTGVTFLCLALVLSALRRIPVPTDPDRDGPDPSERHAEANARILRIGLPVGLQLAAEVGVFALAGALAGRLGREPGAAHQIALNLASLTFSVAVGISAATSVRVGKAVGAGDQPGVRRAGLAGLVCAGTVMGLSALLFVVAPHLLAALLNNKPATQAAALPLIRIAAVFQLSDGAQALAAGALRGAGDTRASFVGNVVGHYAIGLPISIALAFAAGMGAPGLWWGLSAGLTAVAAFLTARFFWLARRPIARA